MKTLKSLLNRTFSHAALREFSWHGAAQVYAQLLSFVAVVIVSRYMGPVNLGIYSFVQNYIIIFFTILSGMDFYFSWQLARSNKASESIYGYISAKLIVTTLCILLGVSLSWIFLPNDIALLVTCMFVPLVFTSLSPFWLYALREKMAKQAAIVFVLAATIIFISKVIVVMLKGNLTMFVLVSGLDMIIMHLLMSFYFLRKKYWREEALLYLKLSPLALLTIIKLSSVSIIYTFLWQIVMRADQLMLPIIKDAYTLGIYSSAVKISEVPNVLISLIAMVIFSRLVNIVDGTSEHERRSIKRIMYIDLLVSIFAATFVIVFAEILVKIIFGVQFLDAVPVLRVYALSIPGLFVTHYFVSVMGAKEQLRTLAYHAGVMGMLTVVLLYLFTTRFGVLGTASASVITYTVSAISLYYLWLKRS